jgi:predicted ArsR family transcriptional regulator
MSISRAGRRTLPGDDRAPTHPPTCHGRGGQGARAPLRLRILRLCLDEERTNKELAEALRKDPGTVLHHVRVLVDGGFLAVGAARRGARGSREKPYRATGKSWQLDFREHAGSSAAAMVEALAAELGESVHAHGDEAILELTRMAVRLRPDDRAALIERLAALREEFVARDDAGGDAVSLFLALHRRP